MNKEIEIKYGVQSEEALSALETCAQKMFPNQEIKALRQTNYFFDTADFAVRRKKFSARLRQEDKNFFLTLKGPSGDSKSKTPSVTNRLEFETLISSHQAHALLCGAEDLFWAIDHLTLRDEESRNTRDYLLPRIKNECVGKTLKIIGSFENLRHMLPVTIDGEAMKLEFDRTRFSDLALNYEVELEIPSMEKLDAADKFLRKLFSKCDLEPASAKSKAERFYSFLTKA